MSDKNYGDPITEEQPAVADVVGSANEGLAEAEAAGHTPAHDSAHSPETTGADESEYPSTPSAAAEPAASEPVASEPAVAEPVASEPAASEPAASEPVAPAPVATESVDDAAAAPSTRPSRETDFSKYETEGDSLSYLDAHVEPDTTKEPVAETAARAPEQGDGETAVLASSDDGATRVLPASDLTPPAASAPAPVTEAEPAAPAAEAAPAQGPIFVQAPEPPLPRGNRGAAALIGLLATVVFAVLYLAVALGVRILAGAETLESAPDFLMVAVQSWWLWVPVAAFFLGFVILGALINRGRWGHWVIFGLFVGVAAYAGHVFGTFMNVRFWELDAAQYPSLLEQALWTPLSVASFIIGRELTIWFGAWVAARGRRVTELNNEAQREYERTIEAGPRL